MKDYRDRLKEYFEKEGIKPSFFVETFKFSNGLINKVFKKELHLSIDKLEKIMNHFPQLNYRYIFTGEGSETLEKDEYGVNYIEKSEWYNKKLNELRQEYDNEKKEKETIIRVLTEKVENLEISLKQCQEGQ